MLVDKLGDTLNLLEYIHKDTLLVTEIFFHITDAATFAQALKFLQKHCFWQSARLDEATVSSKNTWIGGLLAKGQFGQVIASKENSKLIQTKSIAIVLWFYLYSIFYTTIPQ